MGSIRILMMIGMVTCLISVAYAVQGTATFYTPPYVPSSCNGYQNDGVMIAAASDAIWNNRAACGRRYRVRCTGATNQGVAQPCRGQSIVVKIADYCPPGCAGTIDNRSLPRSFCHYCQSGRWKNQDRIQPDLKF